MAASDNPEVGTAMCRGFIQQIMEVTVSSMSVIRNKLKSLRADRVQMFVKKTHARGPVRVKLRR